MAEQCRDGNFECQTPTPTRAVSASLLWRWRDGGGLGLGSRNCLYAIDMARPYDATKLMATSPMMQCPPVHFVRWGALLFTLYVGLSQRGSREMPYWTIDCCADLCTISRAPFRDTGSGLSWTYMKTSVADRVSLRQGMLKHLLSRGTCGGLCTKTRESTISRDDFPATAPFVSLSFLVLSWKHRMYPKILAH